MEGDSKHTVYADEVGVQRLPLVQRCDTAPQWYPPRPGACRGAPHPPVCRQVDVLLLTQVDTGAVDPALSVRSLLRQASAPGGLQRQRDQRSKVKVKGQRSYSANFVIDHPFPIRSHTKPVHLFLIVAHGVLTFSSQKTYQGAPQDLRSSVVYFAKHNSQNSMRHYQKKVHDPRRSDKVR